MEAVILPLSSLFADLDYTVPCVTREHVVPEFIQKLCDCHFIHKVHIVCTGTKYEASANQALKMYNDVHLKKIKIFCIDETNFDDKGKSVYALFKYLHAMRRNILFFNYDTILNYSIETVISECLHKDIKMKLFYPELEDSKPASKNTSYYTLCLISDSVVKILDVNCTGLLVPQSILKSCHPSKTTAEFLEGYPMVFMSHRLLKSIAKDGCEEEMYHMDSFYKEFIPYAFSKTVDSEPVANSKDVALFFHSYNQPEECLTYIHFFDNTKYNICANLTKYIDNSIKKIIGLKGAKSAVEYTQQNKEIKASNSYLGNGIDFEGKATVHHSFIGDNCKVGKNVKIFKSIVSSGAVICEDANIVGSVVMPGVQISSVGPFKGEIISTDISEEIVWQS